ncbi:MAG: YdcF family protein [Chloroflexi bacterium]|nr:YdcF family protein [Chloroflexota bacterium]
MLRWLRRLAVLLLLMAMVAGTAFVAPGFLLEGPSEPLAASDAIIVISGDEALARYREGVRLYRAGWAPKLIFSGATWDGSHSNGDVMRGMAIADGVPASAILVDPHGDDTYGNAVHTKSIMQEQRLTSAVLVTSPYHLQRAVLTFRGVYADTGIRLIGRAAPDGEWRKTNWWLKPETRALTVRELEKLGYVAVTGRYN